MSAYSRVREAARQGLVETFFTRKKPSTVRSPVRKGLSFSSISDVIRFAASASVRASSTVGTP